MTRTDRSWSTAAPIASRMLPSVHSSLLVLPAPVVIQAPVSIIQI